MTPPPSRGLRLLGIALAACAFAVITGTTAPPMRAAHGTTVARAGTGRIEGTVTLPDRRATRTSDRYQSSTGEARDVQDVPAVVYLLGAMPGTAAARPSGPLTLTQKGEAFQPSLLVVPVGARVNFPNGDPLFHNVFSYSRARRFDLGRYPKGEAKTVVFDKPGYVKVLCEVHKWMRAGVLVVENPHYTLLPDHGRFHLDDVPAGRHRVVVETFDRRAQAEVLVPEGGTATVTLSP